MKKTFFVGRNPLHSSANSVTGRLVTLEGEDFYQMANYDRMRPFFMSVVSGSDHWLFISSTGALTAGRRNPDLALFPYTTDDKIHDSAEITGSKSILVVKRNGRSYLWEPFSERYRGVYRIQRNLYKNTWGNKLVFEECNQDLGLTFRYAWCNSARFGFIRKAWLSNTAPGSVQARLLDGIQNVMRGGIFAEGYFVDPVDLLSFVRQANREVAARGLAFFRRLSPRVHYASLVSLAAAAGDALLERLCREYLPLTFSRRHGDPSRPWNRFSIATRKPDGSWALDYEGNWRDIFQNWEALAVSYPAYVAGMICRFVSASTADGYNPYRITRDGIDWEVINPADPWTHIGYWGDHQLIYLLKLLELLQHHEPATLREFLTRAIFAYANVPYRIKPYENLLQNPKETVWFDSGVEELVQKRVQSRGADGKLLWDDQGEVRLVNLTEKLLVSGRTGSITPTTSSAWIGVRRSQFVASTKCWKDRLQS
jgi:hypothetical protein